MEYDIRHGLHFLGDARKRGDGLSFFGVAIPDLSRDEIIAALVCACDQWDSLMRQSEQDMRFMADIARRSAR